MCQPKTSHTLSVETSPDFPQKIFLIFHVFIYFLRKKGEKQKKIIKKYKKFSYKHENKGRVDFWFSAGGYIHQQQSNLTRYGSSTPSLSGIKRHQLLVCVKFPSLDFIFFGSMRTSWHTHTHTEKKGTIPPLERERKETWSVKQKPMLRVSFRWWWWMEKSQSSVGVEGRALWRHPSQKSHSQKSS